MRAYPSRVRWQALPEILCARLVCSRSTASMHTFSSATRRNGGELQPKFEAQKTDQMQGSDDLVAPSKGGFQRSLFVGPLRLRDPLGPCKWIHQTFGSCFVSAMGHGLDKIAPLGLTHWLSLEKSLGRSCCRFGAVGVYVSASPWIAHRGGFTRRR